MSTSQPDNAFFRVVTRIVDACAKRPFWTLFVAIAMIGAFAGYARAKLELRTDLLELLPRDSDGFRAFEHQLGRVGGGATILVVVESPERAANEKLIDAIAAKLQKDADTRKACVAACKPGATCACGDELIAYVESGTQDVRAFYKQQRWLYASTADLENADATLDRQIAMQSGMVPDLLNDSPASSVPSATVPNAPSTPGVLAAPGPKKDSLGMAQFEANWDAEWKKRDDFPSGYFCTPDGREHGLRIVASTSGVVDTGSERLLTYVKGVVKDLAPTKFQAAMRVGFAGDIPTAQAEKRAILDEGIWAIVFSTIMVLLGIALYFRSLSSLLVVFVPAAFGVTAAYAFATAAFGYVNTAGVFLGAIILGNGINYPIVLLARYREFVAIGMSPDEARREAVRNAFRAELVGALVAAIAYGSLTFTKFRGFSQFGMIGFVGMLLVWASIVPLVPALIVIQEKLPHLFRRIFPPRDHDGSSGPIMRGVATITEKAPWAFIGIAAILLVVFGVKTVSFLQDPWEYYFGSLGSTKSETSKDGAGFWSTRAEKVFGGKANVSGARMLADTVEQVPALKAAILANDKKDPDGRLVDDVVTVWDALPGTSEQQKAKLAVLDRIRDRLTPKVLESLNDDERKRLDAMTPPETLAVLEPKDLPEFIKRRFTENDGRLGTVTYVRFKDISISNGHTALRVAATTDNVHLKDGTIVQTASHATIYAEMIKSLRRDGPLASVLSFGLVAVVVLLATRNARGAFAVLFTLFLGGVITLGGAGFLGLKLHYVNFIALPITFGIGCEYPFNVFDRTRLLGGDITSAVRRTAGAVALCSFTTTVGYGALMFNDLQALVSFGKIAVLGEVACVLGALFLVPSILHVMKRK